MSRFQSQGVDVGNDNPISFPFCNHMKTFRVKLSAPLKNV